MLNKACTVHIGEPDIKKNKEVFKITDNDDGNFWMNYEDLTGTFENLFICMYNDDYKYSSAKLTGEYALSKVTLTKKGEYFFKI